MLAAALHETFCGRLAICSARHPLTAVDGFRIGTKLVHGQELSTGFSSSCVTAAAREGNSKTCGFFFPWDPVRLIPSGISIDQAWFGLVRVTKHELCHMSDAASCESDSRLILCLKKWWQDKPWGISTHQHSLYLLFTLCGAKNSSLRE